MSEVVDDAFLLLNDLPVEDPESDLLGTFKAVSRLAEVVESSRGNAPFVLAIDGGWGTGKSTLMRQLSHVLKGCSDTQVVWFNAWAATGASALVGVLKLVLAKLDPNVVRRTVRRHTRDGLLPGAVRLGAVITAGLVRADHVINQLWERMATDAQAREEARLLLRDAMRTRAERAADMSHQTIVVFVDDLDRCGEQTAIEVCEAIKLYLDLPGMVFILGCDLNVLSRQPVLGAQTPGQVRDYLEKIIQVSYRIPVPEEETVRSMVRGYAERSRTTSLFTEHTIALIGRQSSGNPRRVKRLINSFVTEYRLDPEWKEVGAHELMRATILQHFYPELYQQILRENGDTLGEVLECLQVRNWFHHGNLDDEQQKADARILIGKHGYSSWAISPNMRRSHFERLDEHMTEAWGINASNPDCVALFQGFGDVRQRLRLQSKLRRKPLATGL